MKFSNKELEKQDSEITKNIVLILIPIAVMISIISYYRSNSLKHNKKEYEQTRNAKFNGIVIRKREEENYYRAGRFVLLDSYHEERVENSTYYKIEIGDSVYKKSGNDSVCFFSKNGEVIIEDYNKYIRERYYKLLNKK